MINCSPTKTKTPSIYETSCEKQQNAQHQISDQTNQGHWSDEENLNYIRFLCKYKVKFSCRLKKRKIRLFQSMSNYIGTRSTIQCRTHHQKFQNKLGTPKAIIQDYKQQIGTENFKKYVRYQNPKRISWNRRPQNLLKQIQNSTQREILKSQIGIQTDEINEFECKNLLFPEEINLQNKQMYFLFFF